MNINIELVSVGIGLILTLGGIGFKIASLLGDIRISIVRIEMSIQNHNNKLNSLEADIDQINKDVRVLQDKTQ